MHGSGKLQSLVLRNAGDKEGEALTVHVVRNGLMSLQVEKHCGHVEWTDGQTLGYLWETDSVNSLVYFSLLQHFSKERLTLELICGLEEADASVDVEV